MPVKLFTLHNEHAKQVGTATVSKAGTTSEPEVVRKMPSHDLICKQNTELVVICTVVVAVSIKYLPHLYTIHRNDNVPAAFDYMFSSKPYAWNSQAMLPLSAGSGSSEAHHIGKSVLQDEISEVQHPALSVGSGQHFAVRGLSLNNYYYEAARLTVD